MTYIFFPYKSARVLVNPGVAPGDSGEHSRRRERRIRCSTLACLLKFGAALNDSRLEENLRRDRVTSTTGPLVST